MKNTIAIVIAFMMIACGGTKKYTDAENVAYDNLRQLVQSKSFIVRSNTASPMVSNAFMQVANTNILGPGNTANNINIASTSNWLRVVGDTINGNLPFFGEQNFGGSLGSQHQGIEFDSSPENYKVTEHTDKHKIDINFQIEDEYRGNERYNVFITVFPNNSSTIRINSTSRSSIEFRGDVSSWSEEKE